MAKIIWITECREDGPLAYCERCAGDEQNCVAQDATPEPIPGIEEVSVCCAGCHEFLGYYSMEEN